MEIVTSPVEMHALADTLHAGNKIIGFVPTMGYLHFGHQSLIETARKQCDVVVVSIFVNPTQFGPNEDLDEYPRDLEADKSLSEACDVDVLFIPRVEDMYPEGDTFVVSRKILSTKLCGAFRPTHFDGVTTIMSKLLSVITPDLCYLGNKDAQQQSIVKQLARDLFFDCEIVGCPTIREDSGLAMSSRNSYMTPVEVKKAQNINLALEKFVILLQEKTTTIENQIEECRSFLYDAGLEVQYFEYVDRENLEPVYEFIDGHFVICIAALCGTTRLIDNYFIDIKNGEVNINRGIKKMEVSESVSG